MIKAIIFDVDGVLIDSFDANLKFHQDLMNHFGYKIPTAKVYASLFTNPLLDNIKILTQSKDEKEIMKIWLAGKNRTVPYPNDLVRIPDGLDTIIPKLSKQYLQGIVSSRLGISTFQIPQLAKLQKYFKTSVWYQDTKNHKPHPEPLLLAAKRLRVKPKECVYIGDGITDVQAAKAAGMRVISYPKPLYGADATISNFKDLPKIIQIL